MLVGDEVRGRSAKRFNSRESTESPNMPPMLAIEFEPVRAGDYNDDGFVNVADYTVWRDGLGEVEPLNNETVTLGAVTVEDYGVWKSSFGAASEHGRAAIPPEPSVGVMAMLGMAPVCSFFCRSMYH